MVEMLRTCMTSEIRQRGGQVVVVDPRRTETAALANRHLPIRPGTDPYFLLGLLRVLFDENLVKLGRLKMHVNGVQEVAALASRHHRIVAVAGRKAPARLRLRPTSGIGDCGALRG
jgi:anaerobic selenocysteine-containing dehydrogenase